MSAISLPVMPAAPVTTPDRFNRQADLVPRDRLLQVNCLVVGVGAIGRQVATMLAAIGARRLTLVDFDRVDHSNVTTQGYSYRDVGTPKVEALERELGEHFADVRLQVVNDEFRARYTGPQAVFCCVDSMAARRTIWNSVQEQYQFWGDTRMLGETLRVLTATDRQPSSRESYVRSLFDDDQAEPGRCTAQSTIYTASIAAGLLIHQFSRWLRERDTETGLIMNLAANLYEPLNE